MSLDDQREYRPNVKGRGNQTPDEDPGQCDKRIDPFSGVSHRIGPPFEVQSASSTISITVKTQRIAVPT